MLVATFGLVLIAIALIGAFAPIGPPDSKCLARVSGLSIAPESVEQYNKLPHGSFSLIPIGIRCDYTLTDGRKLIVQPQWWPTGIGTAGTAAIVAAAVLHRKRSIRGDVE